jgi:hypothetical protein
MSNFKDLSKSLPDKTQTFEIDVKGEITNLAYKGEFEFTIPNLRQMANIAKNEATLNAGLDKVLDYGTKNLHHMISYLKYTITKAPDFWEESFFGYELMDSNTIETLYIEAMKIEDKWVQTCWGKKEKKEKKDATEDEIKG